MRTSLKVGVVAAFAFVASATAQAGLNLPAMQCSYSFSSDMGLGARSTSVMDLQKVLNMYPETKVASTGAGSPGMETMYFGPATRAAVLKFQSLHLQDTRATGFVGPLTRALLNKVCSGTGNTGGNTGGTTNGSGLNVVAGTNTGGTIIAGAAQVPVLNFKLTNSSAGEVTVNSLKFMKLGTVSDASISNGYLSAGNQIVGQYTSLAQGVMTFANVNAKIPAGATVDMSLRVDLSSGSIAAGNLIGFQLVSANDVVISAGSVGGTFPLVGGNFYTTTVSNPGLATVSSAAYQGVGTQVDAGSTSFRAGAVTFNVTNNPVKVQSVRFNVNGSITPSIDLANLKLRIDGQEVATGMVNGNYVSFDLGAAPKMVNTGSHLMEVYSDVLGTPNRTFKMEILRPYDVVLMDTQYNTNISFGTPSGSATVVTVRPGTATVALATDTPTGTIPLGGSNVTLAKFRVYAAGEALRVKFLPFTLTNTGDATWGTIGNVDADLRNIALYGDDGVQVGSTINTPSGCAYGPTSGANTYSCSFGSSSANINYTIPANTNRVLSLKADIQSTANFSTIRAQLDGASSNVEGQISFQTSNLPGGIIQGSTLSLTTTPFQVALNNSLGSQTIVGGAMNQKIGSFSLSASSAEAINLTSVRVKAAATTGSSAAFRVQNLVVKVDGTSWNYVVSSIDTNGEYVFSAPSSVTIPAGGSKLVDVYADVLNGSTNGAYNPVSFIGAVANGAMTNTNQNLSGAPVVGQTVTIAGAGSLTASVDTSVPPAQQLVLGSTDATVGQFRFVANNNEDIRMDQLIATVYATLNTDPATFKNLRLFDGATQIGQGTALSGSLGVFTSTISLANGGIVIPKNTTKVLTLKADLATFSESPTSHKIGYTFRIQNASDVRAFGVASTNSITVGGTFPMISQSQTSLRTKVTATLAPMGATANRVRTASDNVSKLTLSADSGFDAQFKSVTLSLSGLALVAAQTVELVDDATGVVVAGATGVTGATVTLTPTNPEVITAGTSRSYRVRVNTSAFANPGTNQESFSVQILNATDVVFDVTDPNVGGDDFGLETRAVPLTSTVSYE